MTMTPDPATIEAVARAIVAELARQDGEDGIWLLDDNGVLDYLDQERPNMFAVALAAITALRQQEAENVPQ